MDEAAPVFFKLLLQFFLSTQHRQIYTLTDQWCNLFSVHRGLLITDDALLIIFYSASSAKQNDARLQNNDLNQPTLNFTWYLHLYRYKKVTKKTSTAADRKKG